MTSLYNRIQTKERRRKLRSDATQAERVFWELVRCQRLGGHRFRRQYGTATSVVDFDCPKLRLVVEIDGSSHVGRERHDAARDQALHAYGSKVIHFTNEEVLRNRTAVVRRLREVTAERAAELATRRRDSPRPKLRVRPLLD